MRGDLLINGTDAWDAWGVFLEDESYGKFLSGETMKAYTKNTSRSIDGSQVLIKNPRVEERSFVIVFCFAEHETPFVQRLKSFIEALRMTLLNGKYVPVKITIPILDASFRVIYEQNLNLSQAGLAIGKIAVRFLEPNPTDRSL